MIKQSKRTITSRRKLLSTFTVVGAASQLPNQWVKPIVNSVVLPAHAQMSGGTPPVAPTTTVGFSTGSAIVFDNDNAVLGGGMNNPPLPLGSFIPAIATIGSYLEETLTMTTVCSLTRIDLSFFIDDQTDNSDLSCAQGQTHTFNVSVNGMVVGLISFTTPSTGPAIPPTPPRSEIINVTGSFMFTPMMGTGGGSDDYVVRVEATNSVCNAMGPGGNYRFIPAPVGSADLFGETVCS